MKKGRVALRNKIALFLNAQLELGCKVHSGSRPGAYRARAKVDRYFSRLVSGIAKDGRSIAIYPTIHARERVPLAICEYLEDIESRCGIAGTAKSIGDAWDIVADNPEKWKRKKNTFLHRYSLQKHREKKNGKTSS